jgi:hypothetical protein
MQPNTQQVPGYFVWEAPDQPVVVHLSLDAVDRMGADIMRGFAAVPKRGAEVGGILLGLVERGEKTVVRVESFQTIPTEYRRGPSYLLSDEERAKFAEAVLAARAEGQLQPVGYYRSHTRDGAISLGPEETGLIAQHFADAADIALLVKPFATKVSQAGFFVRKDGAFPEETPLEFPFRRREMLGEEAPARRSLEDRGSRPRRPRPEPEIDSAPSPRLFDTEQPLPAPAPSASYAELQPRPAKRGWVWVPLCFLFLLLGVALGYQTALTFAPELRDREGAKAFALNLTAGRNGDSLTVRWDRDSPAIRVADRAVLEIEDGGFMKPVPLDPAHLREGTVVYQNTSNAVKFRLVVYMGERVTVNETAEWLQ